MCALHLQNSFYESSKLLNRAFLVTTVTLNAFLVGSGRVTTKFEPLNNFCMAKFISADECKNLRAFDFFNY